MVIKIKQLGPITINKELEKALIKILLDVDKKDIGTTLNNIILSGMHCELIKNSINDLHLKAINKKVLSKC